MHNNSIEKTVADVNRGVDIDRVRFDDIETKHATVAKYLEMHRFDALVLQHPSNISWFTSGANFVQDGAGESRAFLFLTPDARVVVTSNEYSDELFTREIPRLGFQLKQRIWQDSQTELLRDLCRGRTVASDFSIENSIDATPQLKGMRLPLNELECKRLRILGKRLVHAVEATARHFKKGQTESEIAGEISHRLLKHCIQPERIRVSADQTQSRVRQSGFSSTPVDRSCVMSVKARVHGLHCAVTRTVCFGNLPTEMKTFYEKTLLVLATGLYFSQNGWEMSETWKRVKRIYEKFGHPDEWQHTRQAEILGYQPTELLFTPESGFQLGERMPLFWQPSIGTTVAGDTILVGKSRFESLTSCENWPETVVTVKGHSLRLPGILKRDQKDPQESSVLNVDDSLLDFSFDDSSFIEEIVL